MSSLDDFASKENVNSDLKFIELELNSSCEQCGLPVDRSWISRNRKILTHVCDAGHEISINGNFDWLKRFLPDG